MILQALAEYYDRKSESGDGLAPAGFENKEIPFILEIDAEGHLIQIEDTRDGIGKKKRARAFLVPQGIKKTSGVAANLLWDTAEYVLGVQSIGSEEQRMRESALKMREKLIDIKSHVEPEMFSLIEGFIDAVIDNFFSREERGRQINYVIDHHEEVIAAISNIDFHENSNIADDFAEKTKKSIQDLTKKLKILARVENQNSEFRKRIGSLPLEDEGVMAISNFYNLMDEELIKASLHWQEILESNPNLTFRLQGDRELICQRRAVIAAMKSMVSDGENNKSRCLVTGEEDEIERLHTSIKGVWGAQSSGANIVSFNLDAFNSYGKSQGDNASVGKQVAFAYTTALNHLLGKDSSQRLQVGDASTVFWAEKATELESGVVNIFGGSPKDEPDRNVRAVEQLFRSVHNGRYVAEDQATRFYVLGLAPNAARIAVRFWHVGTVGEMAERIVRHFEDLKIVHGPKEPEFLPLFRLLVSTATLGKSENIPPNLAGDIMRAILEGLPYPQTLLGTAIRRIKAEQHVSYPRAALIKACINRQIRYSKSETEEEIKVSLDENNTNTGYRLGRLFAVLEKAQEEANPGINVTIRDRYYGSASSSPVTAFSTLMKLSKHHIAKLGKGRAINLERLIGEILAEVQDFPAHLAIADQGRFAIGYYHQRQDFFTKKTEEKEMIHE